MTTLQKRCSPVATMLGLWLVLGCGTTRKNVIEDRGAAGQSGRQASAGTSAAAGGVAGEPGKVSGGGVAGSSAASAGSGGAAGHSPTWDPRDCHVKPVAEPADPTAKQQWTLARAYCVALGDQGCVQQSLIDTTPACSTADNVEACVQEVLWKHYTDVAAACEDAWRKDLACGAASKFEPPICNGVSAFGFPFGTATACSSENSTLLACLSKNQVLTEVNGSYATCSYDPKDTGTACDVSCSMGQYYAGLSCSGPEGLPKQCGCMINGHVSVSVSGSPIFVNDCADAAAQAADGLCTGRIECCFSYFDGKNQVCLCEDDPQRLGFETCDALIESAQGTHVDICPQLLPDRGGCFPPGACP